MNAPQTPPSAALAARLALGLGLPEQAVAIARRAGRDGVMLPASGWPLAATPPPGPVEDAVVLGLIRQESSFDVEATSPVGARGLMQLMPATAASVARKLGLATSVPALTSDPGYNMRLGTSYLGSLLTQFNQAPPLRHRRLQRRPGPRPGLARRQRSHQPRRHDRLDRAHPLQRNPQLRPARSSRTSSSTAPATAPPLPTPPRPAADDPAPHRQRLRHRLRPLRPRHGRLLRRPDRGRRRHARPRLGSSPSSSSSPSSPASPPFPAPSPTPMRIPAGSFHRGGRPMDRPPRPLPAPSPLGLLAAFLLFRLLDITKPRPPSAGQTAKHGAFGIMADDPHRRRHRRTPAPSRPKGPAYDRRRPQPKRPARPSRPSAPAAKWPPRPKAAPAASSPPRSPISPAPPTSFDRGFVTYSNAAKAAMLGVPPETIEAHGAVSAQVARAMAEGALARSLAAIAVSVTGVAGPGGRLSPEKTRRHRLVRPCGPTAAPQAPTTGSSRATAGPSAGPPVLYAFELLTAAPTHAS